MVEVNEFGDMNCEHPTSSMFATRMETTHGPTSSNATVIGLPLSNKTESNAILLQLHACPAEHMVHWASIRSMPCVHDVSLLYCVPLLVMCTHCRPVARGSSRGFGRTPLVA